MPCADDHDWPYAPRVRTRPGAPPPLRVWFAGDSTTAAVGVRDEESWWARVGLGLAGARAVELSNLAVPGAEPCRIRLQVLRRAAEAPPPELLVVGVFADDFDAHQLFAVRDQVVLLPGSAPAWLRPFVRSSYLVNLAWWAIEPRRQALRTRGVDPMAEREFRVAMSSIQQWAEAQGVALVFVLIPASGQRACPARPIPASACERFARDHQRMADLLAQLGARVLDLRPWFAAHEVPVLEADHELVRSGRLEMPLHVGLEGQGPMADELLRLWREGQGAGGAAGAVVR